MNLALKMRGGPPSALVPAFLVLLVITMLCLQFQYSVTFSHTSLQQRLQQVPEQVVTAVRAVRQDGSAELTDAQQRARVQQQMARATAVHRNHSVFIAAAARGHIKRRRAHAPGEATSLADVPAATALPADVAATSSAQSRPPAEVVGAAHSKCAHRRPYHVVLTAASGIYQEWQTRIAYYHYKKLKADNYCSDIGGFTRLLNTPGARPDGLMDEIPTVLVSQLAHGRCDECDHGFIVMNRPWGLRQLLRHPAFADIAESYLFIVETDHLFLKPVPNMASPTTPVAFGFYYMTYKYDPPKLKPVIARYHDPEKVRCRAPTSRCRAPAPSTHPPPPRPSLTASALCALRRCCACPPRRRSPR